MREAPMSSSGGGGVIGLPCARELLERDRVGAGASRGNVYVRPRLDPGLLGGLRFARPCDEAGMRAALAGRKGPAPPARPGRVASGDKVEVDPKSFLIEEGRLLVFCDSFLADTRKKWLEETGVVLRPKADAAWKKIVEPPKPPPGGSQSFHMPVER